MKKIIITTIIIICLIGLFQAGILRALLLFVLIGAVPGTTFSLSPDIMTAIVVTVSIAGLTTVAAATLPRVVNAYRRYVLRKTLLTIPAFRRLIRTRLA